MKVHNLVVTGSLTSGGENISTISSSVASTVTNVSSSVSASISQLSSSLMSSMNEMSSSIKGMMATTGSNIFIGNQTVSGSLIPAVNSSYDLGSPTNEFRHLYLSSASLYIDGTKVLGSTTQELQITTDAGQSFKILEAGSDTITLQSADGNITLSTSGGGDVILDPTTGIIALKGTTTVYAGNRILSSDGNAIHFGNSVTMTGSLIVTGFIETQELRTTYISSSILYRSGSTKFGDELTDTHAFSGSVLISGSISVPGSGLVSGSAQITYSGLNGIPSGIVSGSVQVDVLSTTNIARLATTGSNTFTGNQTLSNGQFLRGIRNSGALAVNLLGIESGSDRTIMTATGDFVIQNGSLSSMLTLTTSGAGTFAGSIRTDGVVNWNGTVGALSYGGGAVTMETNSATPILLKTNGATAITISTGQTVTFANSITAGTSISAGTFLGVTRAGSNGVGEGPYMVIAQPSQSKQWLFQLNGSAGLDYWHYNGSAWSVPLTLTTSGDATFSGVVNFNSEVRAGAYSLSSLNYIDGTNVPLSTRRYRASGNRTNNDNGTVGLDLTNLQSTNGVYSPIISFSTTTSGGVYNCTYAGIWGMKTADEGSWASGDLILGTANPYGVTQRLRILSNGFVGIGDFGGNSAQSNLEIRNNNTTIYDQTSDSGQDGSGVTLTIRNNDITNTGSFSQINMQVSGDSGRALGRIVTIRMGSATSDMAFVTENNNVKSEKLRITSTGNLLPGIDASYNLGSTSLRWNNLYTTDLHLSNEGKQNIVDGTWGDWTLQEGENDIFMLNNRNGEKYKIKLEKIIQ